MNREESKRLRKLAIVGINPLSIVGWGDRLVAHLESYIATHNSEYEIVYFCNYQLNSVKNNHQIKLFHLHQLPEQLAENEYDLILYLIDNSSSSYLYNWFRQSYPGILLLLDASIFHLELTPLMHATDPVGIDSKMREIYPRADLKLGKAQVLGRSLEIYSRFFPMLESLSEEEQILVLESRISNALESRFPNVRALPVVDYIIPSSETVSANSRISNSVLVINLTPFSLSSKEVRIMAGVESYRDMKYPAYFVLELNQYIQVSQIKEVSVGDIDLRQVSSIILTDIMQGQGTPLLIYDALIDGLRVSLPVSLEEEFNKFSTVCFHQRASSIRDIFSDLRNDVIENYTLSPQFFDLFFSSLEELCQSVDKLRVEKKDARRLSLTYKLEKILQENAAIELELGIKHDIKSDIKELFTHEKT